MPNEESSGNSRQAYGSDVTELAGEERLGDDSISKKYISFSKSYLSYVPHARLPDFA
jgi:hypothetical protein